MAFQNMWRKPPRRRPLIEYNSLYLQCVYPSILVLYPQYCAYTSLWMKLPFPRSFFLSSFYASSILFLTQTIKLSNGLGLGCTPLSVVLPTSVSSSSFRLLVYPRNQTLKALSASHQTPSQ